MPGKQIVVGTAHFASEMARAFSDAEFSLVYQPMIDLHTGRITTCEALLRWNHPSRGVILPGNFVSLVEKNSGLCRASGGGYCTRRSPRPRPGQAAPGWRSTFLLLNFSRGDLAQVVRDALTAANLDPDASNWKSRRLSSPYRATLFCERCTSFAVWVCSSRSMISALAIPRSYRLRDFAFDKIKIDRSLCKRLSRTSRSRRLCSRDYPAWHQAWYSNDRRGG